MGTCKASRSNPKGRFIDSINVAITTKVTISANTPIAPEPKTSANASTSLVSLVINFPTGVRSWNLNERLRLWLNKSILNCAVSRWPMVCTKRLWLPCNASRINTATSNSPINQRIARAIGIASSHHQEGSARRTEITCPTKSGCTAPAAATGNSRINAIIKRRRSRAR